MSYPPYNPNESGMYPPPQQMTPSGYPAYPGSAVPPPYSGYPQSMPMPSANPPYPSPQGQPPYPGQAAPYPSHQSSSPYPSQPMPSHYPSQPAPYTSQHTPSYPPQQEYPCQQTAYPNQNSSNQTGSGYSHGGHNVYSNPPHGGHSQMQQPAEKKGRPTLTPAQPFSPNDDAAKLRTAMKGFGTDEKAIIAVLANRTNAQRQEIAKAFKTLYGKDLIKDLKSETSGNFEDVLVKMMTPIPAFLAQEIHDAISGIGTDEETIVEILCSATNNDIRILRDAYRQIYMRSLEDDLIGDTSGHFRRLLVSLCQANRNENFGVDLAGAQSDAQALYSAGEQCFGTDESIFNSILCSRSYSQLNQIFQEYQKISHHDFTRAIENEFSGDIKEGLLAVVKSVQNRPGYFAERLYESMKGFGTKDRTLQRIIVVRSEVDMVDIKQSFQAKYHQSLEDFIKGDCSGDYKKILIALISS